MKEPLLLGIIGAFVVMLIFRFVYGVIIGRRFSVTHSKLPIYSDPELIKLVEGAKGPAKARDAVKKIGRRAVSVETSAAKAAHYFAAGNLALAELKRPGLGVGFYLRALRVDPTCLDAVRKLEETLTVQKRLRRLERTYWDVLGRLDDTEVGSEMWVKCWSGLANLYAASPRTVRRADAIRKGLAFSGGTDDEESEILRSDLTRV